MRHERSTVVGIFRDPADARDAIEALKDAGFNPEAIGILAPDRDQARDLARETGTEAGEGAATGAVAGGILGGLAGWLVGIGALAIPGAGPFVAGGVLAATLGGAAIGAGVGAIAGALIGMGVPEEEAEYYEQEVRSGRTLVTVMANGRYEEARRILRTHGAYDVQDRAAATGVVDTDRVRTTETAPPVTGRPETLEGERTIPVREEELRVRRETLPAGEVEIRKEVRTEHRTIEVPVTREEVVVERRPVDPHAAGDIDPGEIREGETIRVPLRSEEVEVEKRPVVTEEVTISKRPVAETRQFSETVRREEVGIEHGDVPVSHRAANIPHWDEISGQFRSDWERRQGTTGMRWEEVEPYRRYGYEMAHDPRYRSREWVDVEPELRSNYADWSRRYNYRHDPDAWERYRGETQSAWDESRARVRT